MRLMENKVKSYCDDLLMIIGMKSDIPISYGAAKCPNQE